MSFISIQTRYAEISHHPFSNMPLPNFQPAVNTWLARCYSTSRCPSIWKSIILRNSISFISKFSLLIEEMYENDLGGGRFRKRGAEPANRTVILTYWGWKHIWFIFYTNGVSNDNVTLMWHVFLWLTETCLCITEWTTSQMRRTFVPLSVGDAKRFYI